MLNTLDSIAIRCLDAGIDPSRFSAVYRFLQRNNLLADTLRCHVATGNNRIDLFRAIADFEQIEDFNCAARQICTFAQMRDEAINDAVCAVIDRMDDINCAILDKTDDINLELGGLK